LNDQFHNQSLMLKDNKVKIEELKFEVMTKHLYVMKSNYFDVNMYHDDIHQLNMH